MKILKIAIALAATVLMTSSAWALPGQGPSTVPVGPPSTTPNNASNPGNEDRSPKGRGNTGGKHSNAHKDSNQGDGHKHTGRPSHPGHSHRCTPHRVAYIAAGTLLSQTLSKDGSANTYSGELEVAVKRTNHHAAADRDTTKTYKVEHVRITFALTDVNKDGSVGLDDVQANDRVRVIGKISSLAKKCDKSGFTPTLTIKHIVLLSSAPS